MLRLHETGIIADVLGEHFALSLTYMIVNGATLDTVEALLDIDPEISQRLAMPMVCACAYHRADVIGLFVEQGFGCERISEVPSLQTLVVHPAAP